MDNFNNVYYGDQMVRKKKQPKIENTADFLVREEIEIIIDSDVDCHKEKDDLRVTILEPNTPKLKRTEGFACETCNKIIEGPYKYSIHLQQHSPGQFKCPLCCYITHRRVCVYNHINMQHLKKYRFICRFCKKGFADFKLFNEHENNHVKPNKFICVVCNKEYPYSYNLRQHQVRMHCVNIEGIVLSNQCHLCRKIFTKQSTLKKHMKKHELGTDKQTLLCDLCGKIFKYRYKLKQHIRIHTGYKPFQCKNCDKCFIKKEYLVMHERVHSGERPFSCDVCDKSFNQRGPLKIHMRRHTGDKPYHCQVCKSAFISKGALYLHLKSCLEVK